MGTPEWKTDDPDDGVYGVYFTDYCDQTGNCLCAYDDWYAEVTYDDGGNPVSMVGPYGKDWTFTMDPAALYSDYD